MSDIIKIILKGAPGFCVIDEAYEDKLVITSSSINYEYKPHPKSELKTNKYKKWAYKTNSPMFKEIYKRVAELTGHLLENDEKQFARDSGSTVIRGMFEDGYKEAVTYYFSSKLLLDYFRTIKLMVPAREDTPMVLRMCEDYEGNESNEGDTD